MQKISLLEALTYNADKPAIKLVLETSFTKEIRIVMRAGQIMKEHKTPFAIIIEIIKGQIDFGMQGEIHTLMEGDLVTLTGNIPHDLKALNDSIIRLTLSKLDKVERVEKVVE